MFNSSSQSSSNIVDLAADVNLQPEFKPTVIGGEEAYLMNVDAVILLAKRTDTPEARRVYREYRKKKAMLKAANPAMSDADLRQRAITSVMPIFYS